jgi:hypothetical protein
MVGVQFLQLITESIFPVQEFNPDPLNLLMVMKKGYKRMLTALMIRV